MGYRSLWDEACRGHSQSPLTMDTSDVKPLDLEQLCIVQVGSPP